MSVARTFACDENLPKLPIPPLEETLSRYESIVKPLLPEKQFQRTQRVIRRFIESGEGPRLHGALLEYAASRDSFIEEFWDESYLTPSGSVVLSLNPFFIFQDSPTVEGRDQCMRAASLVFSSLRFASCVQRELLAPDRGKGGRPLDMSQYKRLFGACRVPARDASDQMKVKPNSQHLVVLCKNQFYSLQCLHPDGRVGVDEVDLRRNFRAILDDANKASDEAAAGMAVGVLTTESRGEWAMHRERLSAISADNARFLDIIDTALLVLCLDGDSLEDPSDIAAACLHGTYRLENDTQVGSLGNRWYDKLQLIVLANGTAGVCFEHTYVDGHTILRFVSDVFSDVIYRFADSITSVETPPSYFPLPEGKTVPEKIESRFPSKLEFDLDAKLRRGLYFAETRISDLVAQHEVRVLEYQLFGKRFITDNKMSPDAFVQMSIVLGYYSLYGELVTVYEPVMMKAFKHGRTEALRSVTEEVATFVKAWTRPSGGTMNAKLIALRNAAASHTRQVRLCLAGKGVDRHLFALQCIHQRMPEVVVTPMGGLCASCGATSPSQADGPSTDDHSVPPEAENGGAASETSFESAFDDGAAPGNVSMNGGGGGSSAKPFEPPALSRRDSTTGRKPPPLPELFTDAAYHKLNHNVLSTSNCGNPSLRLFGFGPVVRDGFGIGYIIKENQLQYVAVSKCRQTQRLLGKIERFLNEIHSALGLAGASAKPVVSSAKRPDEWHGGNHYTMFGTSTSEM